MRGACACQPVNAETFGADRPQNGLAIGYGPDFLTQCDAIWVRILVLPNVYRSHRKCMNLCAGLNVGDAAEMRQVQDLQDLCSTGDVGIAATPKAFEAQCTPSVAVPHSPHSPQSPHSLISLASAFFCISACPASLRSAAASSQQHLGIPAAYVRCLSILGRIPAQKAFAGPSCQGVMQQIDLIGWEKMRWARGFTLLHWAAKHAHQLRLRHPF